ncbi:hypothetical protein CRG98_001481 [Punica granatum]|uniref:Uncharacterized protein n=1 Tax=Punica granatum TaxID=22663 RepID=A0A2I0LBT9_PUNGR|nr:hypothetical protein CRG98_001481 [Punica granatum]
MEMFVDGHLVAGALSPWGMLLGSFELILAYDRSIRMRYGWGSIWALVHIHWMCILLNASMLPELQAAPMAIRRGEMKAPTAATTSPDELFSPCPFVA